MNPARADVMVEMLNTTLHNIKTDIEHTRPNKRRPPTKGSQS